MVLSVGLCWGKEDPPHSKRSLSTPGGTNNEGLRAGHSLGQLWSWGRSPELRGPPFWFPLPLDGQEVLEYGTPEVPAAFTPVPSQAGSNRLGGAPMSSPAQRRRAQGWCVASCQGFCSMVQILRHQERGAWREGDPGLYHT